MKTKRNDRCSCGSNKKYKVCCMIENKSTLNDDSETIRKMVEAKNKQFIDLTNCLTQKKLTEIDKEHDTSKFYVIRRNANTNSYFLDLELENNVPKFSINYVFEFGDKCLFLSKFTDEIINKLLEDG